MYACNKSSGPLRGGVWGGAKAFMTVWNFNRVADALQLLTRMLLLLVGGHYVDDFNGIEYAEHSDSAFSEFFHVLGLRVKDSKAQPPASRHVIQGVDVHVRHDGAELSPIPRRVAKLRHAIAQSLGSNSLTPREAGRLAGKLSFLTQAVFGAVGRSALQPIYARSHDTQTGDDHSPSVGLRSALSALAHILDDIQPRFMPNAVQPAHDRDDHGWGYVVRIGQVVYYDHGITPRSVLNAITSRRAFIYALEVYAQLMATGWRSLTTRPERLLSGRDTARTPLSMAWVSGARRHVVAGGHSSPGSSPRRM